MKTVALAVAALTVNTIAGAVVSSADVPEDPFRPPGFPMGGPTDNQNFGWFSTWDQAEEITSTGNVSGDLLGTFGLHSSEFQIPCGLGPCLVNYTETVFDSTGQAPPDGTTYEQFDFLGAVVMNEFITGPAGTGDILGLFGIPVIEILPGELGW